MLGSNYFWIVAGALGLFFGMSNPFIHLPFVVLIYPASLYIISKVSQHPFRDGMLCGLIGASASMYWIATAVHVYGFFPWTLAIPCALVMGAYIGLWGALFSFVMKKMLSLDPVLRAISASFLWYICEWLRSFLFTGFPWLTLSSAFAPVPELIQGASLIGAFGLSGVFVGIAILFVESSAYAALSRGIQAPYTKNIVYKYVLSFGGIFSMFLLFIYGDARLEKSFEEDTLLYGTKESQTYIQMDKIIPSPEKNEEGAIVLDYKDYHKDPRKVGAAKHVLLLPAFAKDSLDAEQEMLELETGVFIPKTFFEQKNIALFTAVQGNVSQAVKWDKSFQFATVQKYLRLSEESIEFLEETLGGVALDSVPSVVLFPETALPFYYQDPSPLRDAVGDFAKDKKLIFGAPRLDFDLYEQGLSAFYNRLYFVQGEELSFYDKEHLVPFGEYVPQLPFIPEIFYGLLQGLGGFNPGVNENLLTLDNPKTLKSHPLSSLICYEAIFPEMARENVKDGAQLFVNVSNDAWYDRSSAAQQHLYLSLLRAVEQKRFLVRAGNTGISAFVDDYGRIMGESALFTDETLSAFVGLRTEKTFYFYAAPFIPFIAVFSFLMLFIYAQIWNIYLRKMRVLASKV